MTIMGNKEKQANFRNFLEISVFVKNLKIAIKVIKIKSHHFAFRLVLLRKKSNDVIELIAKKRKNKKLKAKIKFFFMVEDLINLIVTQFGCQVRITFTSAKNYLFQV